MSECTILPGVRRILHGGDYNPDQWLDTPEIIDRDFELMHESGCNTFSIGIFSWTSLEPADGQYRFDWLDSIMDRMAANGFHVLLATPSAAKPAWLAKAHPEICKVNSNGLREPYQTRHNHCWSSPVYRAKTAAINAALAERYANHPALAGWHISNEYAGSSDYGACHCELCQNNFRQWLRDRYGDLDNLNQHWCNAFWNHLFTDWSEITPWNGSEAAVIDWKRFTTWICCDFMKLEVEAVKRFTPDKPAATNMMGFAECLDYWRVAEVCDFICDDVYPPWGTEPDVRKLLAEISMRHDMHRAMKNRPFLIMESSPSATNWQPFHRLKRPGQHRLEELCALGHGADGTLYFQWRKSRGNQEKFHGAVVDHVGNSDTRVFREVAALGRLYEKCGDLCGADYPAQTAVVWDWDNDWALKAASGPGHPEQKKYHDTVVDHYRTLWTANIPMDVIESTCDFSRYKLLICPMLHMLKPGVAARLKEFVQNGGHLVMTYLSGYIDASARCWLGGWPGDGLRELFGIRNEEIGGIAPFDSQSLEYRGQTFPVVDYAEILHLEGAAAIAAYREDFFAGSPAATVNRFGQGKAWYLAARTGEEFLQSFYDNVLQECDLRPVIPARNSAGVHAAMRRHADTDYLFLLNYSAETRTVTLPPGNYTSADDGAAVGATLTLEPQASILLRGRRN